MPVASEAPKASGGRVTTPQRRRDAAPFGRALGLTALLAASCTDGALILEIAGDLESPAELDAMCLSIADRAPEGGEFARRYPLQEVELPQTLAVDPGRADEAVATARGYLRGREVARAQRALGFGEGDASLRLDGCAAAELGDVEVYEAAGAAADVAVVVRGLREDVLLALAPGQAGLWAPAGGALEDVGAPLPDPPAEPRALAAADVTQDCRDEVLLASERGLEVWSGARGGFTRDDVAEFLDSPSGEVVAIAAGDLSGDGAIDVVAGGGDALDVFENDGSGGLARNSDAIPQGAVSDVTGIAVADFSGDGALDILVGQGAESGAPLVLLTADSDAPGTFVVAEGAVPEVEYRARQVVALGAPGAPADAAVAAQEGVLHLVNRGDGRLEDRAELTLPGGGGADAVDIAAADWDGDCIDDLLIAPPGGDDIIVWTGDGDGRFAEAAPISQGGERIALDDLGGALAARDLVITGDDGLFWVTR